MWYKNLLTCCFAGLSSHLHFYLHFVLVYLDWVPFCLTVSFVLKHIQSFHRNGEDWRSNRVILNKEVISPKMLENFVPLLDEVGEDFVARVHKKIKRSGQNKWTADLSQELFKYALECKIDFYLSLYSSIIYFTHCEGQCPFFVSCLLCRTQLWAQCCMGSVWVWCWTILTLKLNISLTASLSCSRLHRPCCTYLLAC